jgi:hypothetical protein
MMSARWAKRAATSRPAASSRSRAAAARLLQGGVADPATAAMSARAIDAQIVDLLEGHLIERVFVGLDGGCQRPP